MRKTLSLKVISLSGKTPKTFSSFFIPENPQDKKLRGSLFAVGSFVKEIEEPLKEQLIKSLQEKYYASSGSILTALENLTAEKIGEIKQSLFPSEIKDLLLAVLWGNILYLSKKGEAEAWLYRGKLRSIKITKSASGHLEEKDNLVLGTSSFGKEVGEEEIEKRIKDGELKILEEKIKGKEQEGLVITLDEAEELGVEERIIFLNPDQTPFKLPELFTSIVKTFLSLLISILKIIIGLISRLFRRERRKIYLVSAQKHFKFKLSYLLVILVVFLLGSVSWGWHRQNKEESLKKFNSLYSETKSKLEEAKSLYKLNPFRAKELVVEAEKGFQEARKLKLEEKKTSELESELNSTQALVNRNYKVESWPVFYDLTLLGKKVSAIDLELVREGLLIVDENSSVYLLDTRNKAAKVLRQALENYSTKRAVIGGDIVYLLTDEGVFSFNFRTEAFKKVIEKDSSWQEIVDIGFWEGNLYLLDSGAKVILKYAPSKETFAKSIFALDENLSQASSLSIDGIVWVLEKNSLSKFLRGKKENFSIKGLDKSFKEGWEVKTSEGLGSLFVLDRGNSRAVILDKAGAFESSYEGESFRTAVSLGVDQAKNQLLILTASKVYQVDLR